MRSVFGSAEVVAREIGGQFVPGRDKIVPPQKIASVCRLFWPLKTAAVVAAIAKKDERTGKRWLSGELDFPVEVFLAVMNEMHKRE
jgi:hypothetical protein